MCIYTRTRWSFSWVIKRFPRFNRQQARTSDDCELYISLVFSRTVTNAAKDVLSARTFNYAFANCMGFRRAYNRWANSGGSEM